MFSVFFWRHARVLLEVFAEETLVWKVHLLCYLLDRQRTGAEKYAKLQHHVAVDPFTWSLPAHLPDGLREIFGSKMHLKSIPGHAPLRLEVMLNELYKLYEQFVIACVLFILIVEYFPEDIAGIVEKRLKQRLHRVSAETVRCLVDLLADKQIESENAARLFPVHTEDGV